MKSGGAVVVNDWIDGVDALLMSWYAGMKEGTLWPRSSSAT